MCVCVRERESERKREREREKERERVCVSLPHALPSILFCLTRVTLSLICDITHRYRYVEVDRDG